MKRAARVTRFCRVCTGMRAVIALMMVSSAMFSQAKILRDAGLCAAQGTVKPQQIAGSVITLKILLVQFSDVRCRMDTGGSSPRYGVADFENLLGSEGVYVSPGMHSPDGDEIFGSVNDYFIKMSGGRMTLNAVVINRRDSLRNTPVWITLWNTKQYYQKKTGDFFDDAYGAASAAGLDVSLSDNTRMAIIYAGNTYYLAGGLNPMAWGYSYIMSELQGRPYNVETPDAKFARIGIHCHEFAHTIGVGHTTGGRADLMYGGTANGSVEGNAPAPLNAIARARLGWAQMIPAGGGMSGGVDIPYSLTDPTVYVMKNSSGDQFFVENRRFDQTMTIGTTVVPDYNNVKFFPPAGPHRTITQGIFVWRVNTTGDQLDPGYSSEGLVCASGRYGRTYPENERSDADDGVPFPGVSNTRLFTPWSDPRNPYVKETDFFGSGGTHYNLFVPNTKGGATCGMEVLSEDGAGGTIRVKFYTSNPPNPALARLPDPDSLGFHDGRRTVISGQPGTIHQVVELGGEILCRRSTDNGRNWSDPSLISQGNGGNSAPCIARAGSALLTAWQMDAYDAADTGRVMLMSRSTDAGMKWSDYGSIGWSYRCGAPGGYPSLAGGTDGSAMLVYRSDRNCLVSKYTRDEGVNWSAALQIPVGEISWATPTVAINESEAVIAYSTDSSSGRARVMRDLFAFGTGSWGNPVCVSGLLPREYAGFGKPDLVPGLEAAAGRMFVAWDAKDLYAGEIPVILSRRADLPLMGNSFTVLKGISKSDFSGAGTLMPSLTGDPSWSYSRVLTIMDSADAASLSVEIGLIRIHHGNGRVDTVRLAAAPPDSLLLDPGGLLNAGCTGPIALESDGDTLAVAAAVYGNDAGKLIDGGRAGFEVARSGSDTAIARFGQQSLASLASGSRTLILYSVPVSSLPIAGNGRTIVLRPFITGLGKNDHSALSLAHVYSARSEDPAGRITTGTARGNSRERAPIAFVLGQNYPNPFNPSTTIRYDVPDRMHVRLSVYNTLGQQVALLVDTIQESGTHEVRFDGGNIASGSYFYRIQAGPYSEAKKLLLLK